LERFPTGVEIGKLQLMRSGRVMMSIGGTQLDISQAIQSNCCEVYTKYLSILGLLVWFSTAKLKFKKNKKHMKHTH
jgi:hypothetical protein